MPAPYPPQAEGRCSICGQVKLADEFHLNSQRPSGLHIYCRPCRANRARDRFDPVAARDRQACFRASKRDQIRAYNRAYFACHSRQNAMVLKVYRAARAAKQNMAFQKPHGEELRGGFIVVRHRRNGIVSAQAFGQGIDTAKYDALLQFWYMGTDIDTGKDIWHRKPLPGWKPFASMAPAA